MFSEPKNRPVLVRILSNADHKGTVSKICRPLENAGIDVKWFVDSEYETPELQVKFQHGMEKSILAIRDPEIIEFFVRLYGISA